MGDFIGKVLVVDDDDSLRDVVNMFFSFEGWEVVEAHNGQMAQTLLTTDSYDLVVSDVNMPLMNGVELLQWCKAEYPDIKFILITGITEIIETLDAFKKGADNFLAKPFTSKSLAEIVIETMTPKSSEESSSFYKDCDYIDIPIEEFYTSKVLLTDTYIKLSGTKYIQIAKKGQAFQRERISKYESKGVSCLAIKKEDFQVYVNFNLELSNILIKTDKVSNNIKTKQMKHAIKTSLESSFIGKLDVSTFNSSKDIVMSLIDILADSEGYGNLLEQLCDHSPLLLSHSVAVGLYSGILCDKIGWSSIKTKSIVIMAGLYHDIGKKEFPIELIEKPRSQFTPEEVTLWDSHPTRGRVILDDLNGVPNDVIQAVYCHHQTVVNDNLLYSENGFNPIARLISAVDMFCCYSLQNSDRTLAVEETFAKMASLTSEEVKPQYLMELMKLFEYEIPADLVKRVKEQH